MGRDQGAKDHVDDRLKRAFDKAGDGKVVERIVVVAAWTRVGVRGHQTQIRVLKTELRCLLRQPSHQSLANRVAHRQDLAHDEGDSFVGLLDDEGARV